MPDRGGAGRRYVVGVGGRRGVAAADLDPLIDRALTLAGVPAKDVAALATLDRRAAEPGVRDAAGRRGWPVVVFPAAALDSVPVRTPNPRVRAAVGTAGVAEAAALLAAGPGAVLVLPKMAGQSATVAVARAAC
jgi:cobalamin biosynthesis protein CbiG